MKIKITPQHLFNFCTRAALWLMLIASLLFWLAFLSGSLSAAPAEYYDITGRRIEKAPDKGIYFVKDGDKVRRVKK